jgi:hypothetical protein
VVLAQADIKPRQRFASELLLPFVILMLSESEFKKLINKLVEPSRLTEDVEEFVSNFFKPINKPVDPDSLGEVLAEFLFIPRFGIQSFFFPGEICSCAALLIFFVQKNSTSLTD